MKVNIYYGGRGLIDDPAIFVMNKVISVLDELNIKVKKYNLYEDKRGISVLPKTLKEAEAVILVASVEWMGIGGFLWQFLDACWLYGDKEKIASTYMQPIVMSTTYGEREGEMTLANAWEILGGLPCAGLCGYVDDLVSFEMNRDYTVIIEKKAENLYRTISQKQKSMPNSNQAVTRTILRTQQLELTPQESEQLSKYVSDDGYVKKQKEDIEELASMFKDMLGKDKVEDETAYISELQANFVPQEEFKANYLFMLDGQEKPLTVQVDNWELNCFYGQNGPIDVYTKLTTEVMDRIIHGEMTFQRAFMTGDMTAKGNFKTLRMLDRIFIFPG